MTVTAITHLNFTGDARQALQFYHSVFGGQLLIRTYGQTGAPRDGTDTQRATFEPVAADSPDADRVSFGMLIGDNGFRLAAYDVLSGHGHGLASGRHAGASTRAAGLTHTEPFFVVLNGDTRAEVEPLWKELADGGTVIQTLAPSDLLPSYGMLTDRYAVTWIFGAMT